MQELLLNYYIYMESLSFLRSYEIKEGDSIEKYRYYSVWSNIAMTVIFSIIEKIDTKNSLSFVKFLINNFKEIKNSNDIKRLSEKHKQLNSSKADSIHSFYVKNLPKEEIGSIEKCFDGVDFKDIIKKELYGKIRLNLVHYLSHESLSKYEVGFEEKGETLVLSDELNAERFIYLSWKAVLRHFTHTKTS